MWCMHDSAPAYLAMVCEMFSITPFMTDWYVEKEPLHGIYSLHIQPFVHFYLWRHLKPTVYVVPVNEEAALYPCFVDACQTVSFATTWNRCYVLNLMEFILSIYYKFTFSYNSQNNVSGHMLLQVFFLDSVCGSHYQSLSAPSSWPLYIFMEFFTIQKNWGLSYKKRLLFSVLEIM
jgi:hypothetical protein